MIFVVGDVHGHYEALQRINRFACPDDIIIQVGDFSFSEYTKMIWEQLYPRVICPVYAIGGNHEDYDFLDTLPKDEVVEVADKLFYVPRGTVMMMEGLRIGFLGGAESLDKYKRNVASAPKTWWSQESILQEDVDKLVKNVGNKGLDVLIVHSPPNSTKMGFFPAVDTESWSLPSNWSDESARMVDVAVVLTNPKKIFCGHMHRSIVVDRVQFLAINEVAVIGDLYMDV